MCQIFSLNRPANSRSRTQHSAPSARLRTSTTHKTSDSDTSLDPPLHHDRDRKGHRRHCWRHPPRQAAHRLEVHHTQLRAVDDILHNTPPAIDILRRPLRQVFARLCSASALCRNEYISVDMKARCLLSAAPPWPPSIFS